jgi:hypothetical protein
MKNIVPGAQTERRGGVAAPVDALLCRRDAEGSQGSLR